ncbi:ATP-binding protein [Methanofollis tationis]|uniref:ATP-binding protein n=1 Tax=Methanofollis tationis TaxID=81417 RepID=UPI001C40A20B|nr:ATP-binding protein [Methanofollis tationis]
MPGALAAVTGALERLGVPGEAVQALELAVDEAVTNIMLHGYSSSECRIWISCGVEGGVVRVRIEDEGVPFDPTEAAEPDLEGDADERPIGGLGIHLIRRMTDELRYERAGGRNILVLEKIL